MSLESKNPLEKPEEGIKVPGESIERIMELTNFTREEIKARLPINLGRGIPPFTNRPLCDAVDGLFLEQQERGRMGFPTYAGRHHPDVGEKNAFRGDKEYIDLARNMMKNEFGLEVGAEQILTGTNGGQDLVTEILDYHVLDEQRHIATRARTFDRAKRHLMRRMGIGAPKVITPRKKGETMLGKAKEHFSGSIKGAIFLVDPGSNPDGENMDGEDLRELIELAHKAGGKILIDGAYARLHHKEENQTDLSNLRPYFDDGTLSMVFTATKEGGKRGPAFAVGSAEFMNRLVKLRGDRMLSPNYDAQIKHVMMETMTSEELKRLELPFVSTFKQFLDGQIRPHLALNFSIVKTIMGEAGIRLSNSDVTHGYNVSVLLPEGEERKKSMFFAKLKTFGVNSGDLSNFAIEDDTSGLRIPFGGFAPEECKIFCTLIGRAYREVYG